jgi:hypothetical protein
MAHILADIKASFQRIGYVKWRVVWFRYRHSIDKRYGMSGEVKGGIELKEAYKESFKALCVWEVFD